MLLFFAQFCLGASLLGEEQAEAGGLSVLEQQLALTELWLDAKCAYDEIPGMSLALVKSGEVLWTHAVGLSDVAQKKPLESDSIFCVASISKLFTALAVMQLRDAGQLGLDDPVVEHLPWFEIGQVHSEGGKITIRSLLTHSSGLPREIKGSYWTGDFDFPDEEELKKGIGERSTLYAHQRKYQYSNLGFSLLGAIVEKVSGKPYAIYVQEKILIPLEMGSTFMERPAGEARERIVVGYTIKNRAGERAAIDFRSAEAFTAAAGMWSTAADLAKFSAWQQRALAGEKQDLLDANTLREMQRPHWMGGNWGWARGLGFYLDKVEGGVLVGHGGVCPGQKSQLWSQPEERLAVIVLANAASADPGGVAKVILRGFRQILRTRSGRERKVGVMEEGHRDYLGTYHRKIRGGELEVFAWGGKLATLYFPSDNPFEDFSTFKELEKDHFRHHYSNQWAGQLLDFGRDEEGVVSTLIRSGCLWKKVKN